MGLTATTPASFLRCRLCTGLLKPGERTDVGVCASCITRPGAQKFLQPPTAGPRSIAPAPAFTVAERSLIRHTGAHLPAAQLLQILNDRLVADQGPSTPRHTLVQLQAEIEAQRPTAPSASWSSLRRTIAVARKEGVLALITPQVLDDFAVVYQLSPAQVTHVRDVIASAQE